MKRWLLPMLLVSGITLTTAIAALDRNGKQGRY